MKLFKRKGQKMKQKPMEEEIVFHEPSPFAELMRSDPSKKITDPEELKKNAERRAMFERFAEASARKRGER